MAWEESAASAYLSHEMGRGMPEGRWRGGAAKGLALASEAVFRH